MPKPYLTMEAPHGDGTVTRGFDACNIAAVLKNPLYVRADKNVYEYLLKNNYRIIDDVDAFDGKHGLFWHNSGARPTDMLRSDITKDLLMPMFGLRCRLNFHIIRYR